MSWKETSSPARRRWLCLLAILTLLPSLIGSVPAAAKGNKLPKAQTALLDEAQQAPDSIFRVIVKRHNGTTQADADVANAGGQKVEDVAAGAFVANIQGQDISDLAQDPSVDYLSIDAPMQPTAALNTSMVEEALKDPSQLQTLYPETVGASQEWAQGVTGSGVTVAVIDTGLVSVLDFTSGPGKPSRVVAQQAFNSQKATTDGYGHGTHVAGIISGDSYYGAGPVQGKYIGVAPDSNLVNLRVAADDGTVYLSDVVNAIEWVIANRAQYNIRVINLSMTSTVAESYHTSLLDAAVEHAWFNGILVVVAAGNNGPNSNYFAPADDPFVITVGATDSNGTVGPADDFMAPWSSSGSNPDGVTKPDVVAPGRYITSTLATKSEFQKHYASRVVDKTYIWMSGTSMSAAVVSGVAALIFQAHPEWTNDQVKWALEQTATRLSADPLTQGAGEVNAAAAVNYSGTPLYANQGLEINLNLVGPNGSTTYNNVITAGSAWSGSAWSGSAWSGSAWSASAWSGSAWSGSTWSGSVWTNAGDLQ